MNLSIAQLRPNTVSWRTLSELVLSHNLVPFSDTPELADSYLGAEKIKVTGISNNSAEIKPGDIFVALEGGNTHGIKYLEQAILAGAIAVVTDEAGKLQLGKTDLDPLNVPIYLLSDRVSEAQKERAARSTGITAKQLAVRDQMGLLATDIYQNPTSRIKLFGITGTNGKTTTSFLLKAITNSSILGTIQVEIAKHTIPSKLTTVESPQLQALLAISAEAGADMTMEVSSHALTMGRVTGAHYRVAGFTNLQLDHLDFHETMENYFYSKQLLFRKEQADYGVVVIDDSWGKRLAKEAEIPVVTVSANLKSPAEAAADWQVKEIVPHSSTGTTEFTLQSPTGELHLLDIPFTGDFNVANAALALVMAVTAGVNVSEAIAALKNVPPIPGRMEPVITRSESSPLVLVDFAHTPDALKLACEAAREVTEGNLILVFGAGGDRDPSKRFPFGEVAASFADLVIISDDNPRSEDPALIRDAIENGAVSNRPSRENIQQISPREDAIKHALKNAKPVDTVLITGKGHESGQIIAGVTYPFSDREVVLRSWSELND